ncbi:Methionine synthase [termite gut metagenome]|uniref:Methionine synthase n=1 Tax=termite gut metagenome TaxID=433724 RepID=A0A5J4Q5X8_9ZZZZ
MNSVQYLPYRIQDVVSYINWIYFFHAWGFEPRFATIADIHDCEVCRTSWIAAFPEIDRPKAAEAVHLNKEACRMLQEWGKEFKVQTLFKLCRANADGDNLLLDDVILPLLRQQTKKQGDDQPYLCLSDFVRPLSSEINDTVGVFASTVNTEIEQFYEKDPHKQLLAQTLADRLAEAGTEKMHEYVRKTAWGYAKDENLPIKELLLEKFQGIRPAIGYPSIPDQSINFILNDILDMSRIGITLTENGAMNPHASVCGLMIAHPSARYFSVGTIDEIQLSDYAMRRGKTVEEIRKFLNINSS